MPAGAPAHCMSVEHPNPEYPLQVTLNANLVAAGNHVLELKGNVTHKGPPSGLFVVEVEITALTESKIFTVAEKVLKTLQQQQHGQCV